MELSRAGHMIRQPYNGEVIHYLHPFCMLLSKSMYFEHPRFTVYGLPPLVAMLDLHDKSMMASLRHFPCRNYVVHASGGTRVRYGDVEDIVPGFSGRKGESQ
jgi:hypothetical protein